MENCTVPQENIWKVLQLPDLIPVIQPVVQNTFLQSVVTGIFRTIQHLTVLCGWCLQLAVPMGKCFGFLGPICSLTL